MEIPYSQIWCVDFEFDAQCGNQPDPVCLVAKELRTGRLIRLFADELKTMKAPPYSVGEDALFVAYFASAELGCHLALGWPMPSRILDLYVEFSAATNGGDRPSGRGLVGALIAHGLDSITGEEKTEMRDLVMRGGPWSEDEQASILDYCQSDVDALERLLPVMLPRFRSDKQLAQALLRGRYMAAVARMEWDGTPIDTDTLSRLLVRWDEIKGGLINAVDIDFGVYVDGRFNFAKFGEYLTRHNLPWPRLATGALASDRDTFREMARTYPQVTPLHELRHTLTELRPQKLAVGRDDRNRTLLSPFGAKTGRNTPRSSEFIFGPSKWIRSLIKPPSDRSLAYVDYSAQEIGIAAALSGDPALIAAYESGDPYIAFAVEAGLAPPNANKRSHPGARARCKVCMLAVNYGMSEHGLALRLGESVAGARELMQRHRDAYRKFWNWSDQFVDTALLTNRAETVFGWPILIGGNANPRSLQNFPMQGNGAEMLRLACSLATEAGLSICAPIHDALLLEADSDSVDAAVAELREHMAAASRAVLGGFEIRTDVEIVSYPDRYMNVGGSEMWARVMELLIIAETRTK